MKISTRIAIAVWSGAGMESSRDNFCKTRQLGRATIGGHMHPTFLVDSDLADLGPLPKNEEERVVEYKISIGGQVVDTYVVRYGTPLDIDLDAPGCDLIKIQPRWPWSSSQLYNEFKEPYGTGRI